METVDGAVETADAAVETVALETGEAAKTTVALETGEVEAKKDCCSEESVALRPIWKQDVLLWPYNGLFLDFSKLSQIPIFTCRVVELQLLIIFHHFIHRGDNVPF